MENKTCDKIINIAFKFFLEKGYEATNVRAICQEIGIKSSSLYFYYKSKQELFFTIYDEIITDYIKQLKEIDELNENISIHEKLYALLKTKMDYFALSISRRKFILRYHMFPPEEIATAIRERYAYIKMLEKEIILQAVEKCWDWNEISKERLDNYLSAYKRLEEYLVYHMAISNIKLSEIEIIELWEALSIKGKENEYEFNRENRREVVYF